MAKRVYEAWKGSNVRTPFFSYCLYWILLLFLYRNRVICILYLWGFVGFGRSQLGYCILLECLVFLTKIPSLFNLGNVQTRAASIRLKFRECSTQCI